tara:strand:+ start:3638 stop:4957 length:1320 start_codon:yes stop_codon:yes gene_type:complete
MKKSLNKIMFKSDIINFFQDGCKKRKQLNIGVEHEKFIFQKKTNQRVNFQTISKIFEYLKKFGWKPIKEINNIIALSRGKQNISLEPGNQVELSGAKYSSIHLVCNESYKFLNELNQACKTLNLKMMSIGYDPISQLKNVPKTPKQRYKIMTEEMPKNGKLSLEMMYQTCGTQINLDYASEKDFIKKFKLSSYLVPLSIAMFANSPIKKNKLTPYFSYRAKIWQSTSRGGLPKKFLEDMNFEKYADMIINSPLLFILKDSKHFHVKNKTFKDFMEGNIDILKNKRPSINDLKNHLSTIFTELRLKQYIEIRSLDTCEWDCHCGGPAFYLGLLYGNLNEALDIINKWKSTDVLNAYAQCPKKGLNTIINNKTLLEWGKIFVKLSKVGLKKRSIKNKNGKDESIFLRNIENILKNNKTKADIAIEKFNRNKSLDFMYEKTH